MAYPVVLILLPPTSILLQLLMTAHANSRAANLFVVLEQYGMNNLKCACQKKLDVWQTSMEVAQWTLGIYWRCWGRMGMIVNESDFFVL